MQAARYVHASRGKTDEHATHPDGRAAAAAPERLEDMQLPIVMMRDILLKTMFRKNVDMVSDLPGASACRAPSRRNWSICARAAPDRGDRHAERQRGSEMGYQLTDAGKARALDALAQSEYFGAMPVPLAVYREQVKRQSIRNIQITRNS